MADKELVNEDQQSAGLAASLTEEKVKPRKGMVGRIWSAMGLVGHLFFRNNKEDFEKRLQHLSKEEVAVHSRLKARTQLWRKFARNLILYSVIGEILVLGVAIYSTRNADTPLETRAWRALPVFALPIITSLLYSSCARFNRMRERKDQKTLERLRAERQAKINELKEKTNYYLTQQLIQKYDLDPAAKAAAASVLASKLGSESGLKFEFQALDLGESAPPARSSSYSRGNEAGGIDSSGLRNRKGNANQPDRRASFGQSSLQGGYVDRMEVSAEGRGRDIDAWEHQKEVEHHRGPGEGGWIARLAAMLVGEDPSQCYALICAKCRMHNGLAKKEDYQYITYYCPHCHALNKSNQLEGSEASDQPGDGGVGTPGNDSEETEEVFSSSAASLIPLQDAASNSASTVSLPLASIHERPEEFQSKMKLSDS